MNLILCGYQGCGKTSVGRLFSEKFNYDFIDTDELIAKNNDGVTSDKLYHQMGAVKFREMESATIQSIKPTRNTMIATGGGVVLNIENVQYLKSIGKIIYLFVKPEIIFERMTSRHFKENFENYIESRKTIYEAAADFIVDASDKTIEETALIIKGLCAVDGRSSTHAARAEDDKKGGARAEDDKKGGARAEDVARTIQRGKK